MVVNRMLLKTDEEMIGKFDKQQYESDKNVGVLVKAFFTCSVGIEICTSRDITK